MKNIYIYLIIVATAAAYFTTASQANTITIYNGTNLVPNEMIMYQVCDGKPRTCSKSVELYHAQKATINSPQLATNRCSYGLGTYLYGTWKPLVKLFVLHPGQGRRLIGTVKLTYDGPTYEESLQCPSNPQCPTTNVAGSGFKVGGANPKIVPMGNDIWYNCDGHSVLRNTSG